MNLPSSIRIGVHESGALTDGERETLNAAERILVGLLVPNEVMMFSLHSGWAGMSMSYFTPNKVQHTSVYVPEDNTLAGKVDKALALRADEENRADEIKAKRVAALKAELAALEPVA
jgi:hypothetical protein